MIINPSPEVKTRSQGRSKSFHYHLVKGSKYGYHGIVTHVDIWAYTFVHADGCHV